MNAPARNDAQRLLHFLLIEDDDDHATIVIRTLKNNRIANRVDRVADGREGLDYLKRQGAYQDASRPDVVLLDLKLPKVDGHEVLAQVKEDPELRSIPVVVLTTSAAERDRQSAYRLHANSYLVKPVDFEQFRTMVSDLGFYWGVWNKGLIDD